MIGLSPCTLFYETAKSCVGSLRPHFFAVCRPSIDLKNCTSKYTYITDYNCTAPENDLLIDSRQATPWSDILYSVVEKVKVIPLVHAILIHYHSCTYDTVWQKPGRLQGCRCSARRCFQEISQIYPIFVGAHRLFSRYVSVLKLEIHY